MKDEADQEGVSLPDLKTRVQWVEDWDEATEKSRKLSTRDRQYYDNDQWTDEEIRILQERGQPVITKNRIARKINYILGEEIEKRVNPCARPRTPQHEDSARAATDALRYVSQEQKFDNTRSCVLKNVLIEGFGGAIKEYEDQGDGEFKHVLRHIEWDRLFYDPHSRAVDFSDAKYVGVHLWKDMDDAIEEFPEAEEQIRRAIEKGKSFSGDSTEDSPRGWVDSKRQRIKIAEMYFRIGDDYYRSVFTEAEDLEASKKTRYLDEKRRHSLNPLLMMSCYVDKDGSRYGIVRQLISAQDEINKRTAKALHLLSVRQVIAERDSVRDPQKFQDELAKPDGFAETEPGAISEGRIQTTQTGDMAQGQVQLLQQAQQDIDSIGPSASMLPDTPSSMSGRAFLARTKSAAKELGTIFDQLRSWSLAVFSLDWVAIRQWWTEEKWLRVTDDQELTGYRFVQINKRTTRAQRMQELIGKGVPPNVALDTAAGAVAVQVSMDAKQISQQMAQEAQTLAQQAQAMGAPPPGPPPPMDQLILNHPLMQQEITVNQVDQMMIDIILDEAPDTTILAQEEFDTLTELLPTVVQARPDMGPAMVKMIIKACQLPNKRELLQELEKGPDQAQVQAQEQAKQLQDALQKANVEHVNASAQLKQAQAAKTQTETQMLPEEKSSKAEQNRASALNHAASAGEKVAMPGQQSEVLL